MALYVQVDLHFFSHRKVLQGARLLKIKPPHFAGHIIALWAWCMINAPKGSLKGISNEDIAKAALWNGKSPDTFCEILASIGFFDTLPGASDTLPSTSVDASDTLPTYFLHGWEDKSGAILAKTEREAIRLREYRAKQKQEDTEERTSTVQERPQVQYAPNLTKPNLTKQNLLNTRGVEKNSAQAHDAPQAAVALTTELLPKIAKSKSKATREENHPNDITQALAVKTPSAALKINDTIKQKAKREPTDFFSVWELYQKAMLECWAVDLAPAPTFLSMCKSLISKLGLENARLVARYYPTRRKDWYIKNGHDLKWCLNDATLLLSEAQSGIKRIDSLTKEIASKERSEEYNKQQEMKNEIDLFSCSDEELQQYIANKETSKELLQ